MNVATI